jgi:hypothetical protein
MKPAMLGSRTRSHSSANAAAATNEIAMLATIGGAPPPAASSGRAKGDSRRDDAVAVQGQQLAY